MTGPVSFPPGAGIIFDMDGLMLDTERIARIAWQQAARAAGHEMSDALFASLIGRRDRDSAALIHAAFGTGFDYEATNRTCNALYNDYIKQNGLPLKTGVRELLEYLTARSLPLAVATSTGQPTARLRLEQTDLARYFSVVVGGNEIEHGKPAPDIYLEAIRRLGVDASMSFALEDSHCRCAIRSCSRASGHHGTRPRSAYARDRGTHVARRRVAASRAEAFRWHLVRLPNSRGK